MGLAFAIAQRMRCSCWEIDSGLFTATTGRHGHLRHRCLGVRKKTMDIMEERWWKEVPLTPGEASLSMPQGQGSLLGHHTLSTFGMCKRCPPNAGPLSRCPVSPRS